MRRVAPIALDNALLEAFHASVQLWLSEVLVWLAQALENLRDDAPGWANPLLAAAERRIDAELRVAVRDLRAVLICYAYARLRLSPLERRRCERRPMSVRRVKRSNSFLRIATAPALKAIHTGSLRERAERLHAALGEMEPLIEATRAQLARLYAAPRPLAVIIPFPQAVRTRSLAPATETHDTSSA